MNQNFHIKNLECLKELYNKYLELVIKTSIEHMLKTKERLDFNANASALKMYIESDINFIETKIENQIYFSFKDLNGLFSHFMHRDHLIYYFPLVLEIENVREEIYKKLIEIRDTLQTFSFTFPSPEPF